MKKKKFTATIISTAIGISTVIPAGIPEITTYADTPVTFADANNNLGDVNNDGRIEAIDASIVLEEYSLISTGKDSMFSDKQKKSADVDKNGEIDASDATIILSYYSYISTGGQLDIEQFMELMLETPVQSTTTTTAKTTSSTTANTTTSASNTTANTTTSASNTTANTTTSASNTTASTTTSASNTTANTTTSASNTTANTTTSASNTTANTTTSASNTTASTTTSASNTTVNTTTSASNTTASTTTSTSNTTANTTTSASNTTANTTTSASNTTTNTTTSTSNTTASTTTSTSSATETTASTTTTSSNKVSEIIVNRNEINIGIGQSERITDIKVIPQNAVNQEMKWTSSDDSIAIVNNLGWIIGKKAGQCKIIIQSVDNPNAFAVIIVNVSDGEPITTSTSETTTSTSETTTTTSSTTSTTVSTSTETTTTKTTTTNIKVTEISVSKNSITLSVGGKDIPLVTMYPENASDKGEIWVSSNEEVATVDKYGWIKGVSVGECKVTVYSVSDPSVYTEIEVKVVDENVPVPEFNFSYVLGDKSDAKNIAFYTPIPKDVSGRFNVDYVITDTNGKITKLTYTIFAPEMNSIVTPLTAETNNFTVSTYITNLETNDTAKIGTYEFSLVPRDAKTITENIPYAFSIIGGLNK